MVCRLDAPTTHTELDDLIADLGSHLGVSGTVSEDGRTLVIDAPTEQVAWSVGQYLVAKANRHALTRVQVADREWVRASGASALEWQGAQDAGATTRVVATLTPPGE